MFSWSRNLPTLPTLEVLSDILLGCLPTIMLDSDEGGSHTWMNLIFFVWDNSNDVVGERFKRVSQ